MFPFIHLSSVLYFAVSFPGVTTFSFFCQLCLSAHVLCSHPDLTSSCKPHTTVSCLDVACYMLELSTDYILAFCNSESNYVQVGSLKFDYQRFILCRAGPKQILNCLGD